MTGRPLLLAALIMLSLSGCAGGYYERYDTYGSGYYGYPGGWGNRGFSGPYYSGRGWRGPGWRRPPPQNFHGQPPGRGGRQNRGSHWRH